MTIGNNSSLSVVTEAFLSPTLNTHTLADTLTDALCHATPLVPLVEDALISIPITDWLKCFCCLFPIMFYFLVKQVHLETVTVTFPSQSRRAVIPHEKKGHQHKDRNVSITRKFNRKELVEVISYKHARLKSFKAN